MIISGESKFRHSCFDARVSRFHKVRRFRSSSTSTLVFYQRSVSTILRSTFVFHRRSSSIDVRLPSTFVFHRRSSSIDVRLPSTFVFYRRSVSTILRSTFLAVVRRSSYDDSSFDASSFLFLWISLTQGKLLFV